MQLMIIDGYNNYSISNTGEVKNIKRNKIMKLETNEFGYLRVQLWNEGKSKKFFVHRLVALAFIPNKNKKPHVNHIDENKKNNSVKNLNWMTEKENYNHGTAIERQKVKISGRKNYKSKEKEYYCKNSTRRTTFKRTCIRQNWNFKDFIEVDSGTKCGRHIKCYYIFKKELI